MGIDRYKFFHPKRLCYSHIRQGSPNYSLGAKSGPLHDFIRPAANIQNPYKSQFYQSLEAQVWYIFGLP